MEGEAMSAEARGRRRGAIHDDSDAGSSDGYVAREPA